MKRTVLTLSLGIVAGTLGHLAWFNTQRPEPIGSLETQLAWIRADLGLAPEQFSRIKQLHEQLEPQRHRLAAEVARLRAEFAAFERERVEAGEVDFLKVARAAAASRTLDRECNASARELIAAASNLMTVEQRRRYLEILAPALKDVDVDQTL